MSALIHRIWATHHPPTPAKSSDAIRVGLLGASSIAPISIILPAQSHPEVIIAAVAARDLKKATAYAKKYGIETVHKSYEDLLADPSIDAIYISLPNNLHAKWAHLALKVQKHVLLEKPSTSNHAEALSLFSFYSSLPPATRPVLLEAFHHLHHPSFQAFLSLSPQAERILSVSVRFSAPAFFFARDDIRFQYKLSGGAMMDMGAYGISCLRSIFRITTADNDGVECTGARAVLCPVDKLCDEAMRATYAFPHGAVGVVDVDLARRGGPKDIIPMGETPRLVVVEREVGVETLTPEETGILGEGDNNKKAKMDIKEDEHHTRTRTLTFLNFIAPSYWHRIDIEDVHRIRAISTDLVLKTWTVRSSRKVYTWPASLSPPRNSTGTSETVDPSNELVPETLVRIGDETWSTYRHQLEQFVNRVRGRPGAGTWVVPADSVALMGMIDGAYVRAGLPVRPSLEEAVKS